MQDEETDVEGARIVIPRSIKQCQRMVEVSSLNGYMRLLHHSAVLIPNANAPFGDVSDGRIA